VKSTRDEKVFNGIGYALLTLVSLFCIIPFWLILSGSLSSEASVIRDGFSLWPRSFSLNAYQQIVVSWDKILRAYGVTFGLTIIGTLLGLFITSMAGYVLQRQDFKYRNMVSFFIYFTTLFSGGMVPWYIMIVKYLELKDSYLALLLPPLVSAWFIILMKSFMRSIPDSITESAKIDGAGDFRIYAQIIVPLATPGLATIGLFIALNYWNDWFHASLFINTETKYPLQYFLHRLLTYADFLRRATNITSLTGTPPSETLKMATAVVVTGPIVFLYPFVQKYFVKGLTIGAVKG